MGEEIISDKDAEPLSISPGFNASAFEPGPVKTDNKKNSPLKIVWNRNSQVKICSSVKTQEFRKKYFKPISDAEWNNWHWQLRNRITNIKAMERFLKLSPDELFAGLNRTTFPVAVTPYYMSLLEIDNPLGSLRRTVIPINNEQVQTAGESEDPLGEENDSPVPGIVHRYPDRVLFLVTDFCSTYCRYCTRSRIVGKNKPLGRNLERWLAGLNYIESTPNIRDVLLSGGDPLTLSDGRLQWLLERLRRISHVETVRIGTKVPVVLPQRVNSNLIRMLKRHHPLWMFIHFTHPDELTPETKAACERLADCGIPLGSQTVLMSGINDNVDTMKRLYHGLLKIRVKPYYLYQCDPIKGSSHFKTPVSKGLEIIQGLRGHTSGYAVPTYVIDGPGGGGKIPLLPEYLVGREGNDLLLRNYQGWVCRYPDTSEVPVASEAFASRPANRGSTSSRNERN